MLPRAPAPVAFAALAALVGCASPSRSAADAAPDAPAFDAPALDAPERPTPADARADLPREAPPTLDAPRDLPAVDADVPERDALAPDAPADAAAGDAVFRVVVTANPAHSFGVGTATGVVTWWPGERAGAAALVYSCPVGNGPEAYEVTPEAAAAATHLYVVAWDYVFGDTHGMLAQAERGAARSYTGDPAWQVCATGVDHARSAAGPSHGDVNAQIIVCNEGAGAAGLTSEGWVDALGALTPGAVGSLVVGEANDLAGGTFPQVCTGAEGGVDEAARWVWYQPGGVADPFRSTGSNTFRTFLIFRLALRDIPR